LSAAVIFMRPSGTLMLKNCKLVVFAVVLARAFLRACIHVCVCVRACARVRAP
jgi:hypothetical protein